ncbi:YggS family pyridoxal phosphate-dependent enzyme [Ornithinimicrobium cerasi]|uniref:YggS family pyridoxal phosphate-dependent enzyme n=1 Tax=Ornithinimicrobium cerasi TaxID=2248773 RepID=UPI001F00B548|nr:YggS family pyridoxal phosphate-dependent enzyme [Ornithinimicrobium cerasi]
MVGLEQNLSQVRDRIRTACSGAGRDVDDVTLVAVTKFFPASDVEHLAGLGVRVVGESRDQEAGAKLAELAPEVRSALTVHFVGQVQTNKANHVARYADVVQSVDRAKLARALDRGAAQALEAGERHTPLAVTIQVELGEGADRGRGGALPEEVPALAEVVADAEHLDLRGLMAVAPLGLDEAGTAAAFDRLMALSATMRSDHPDAMWVSAGMSGDLELAIRAGATHLRVGTAILGSRASHR